MQVFVANPNKSPAIVNALYRNRDRLLGFLDNFHVDKGKHPVPILVLIASSLKS
jgi:hypothetical protein